MTRLRHLMLGLLCSALIIIAAPTTADAAGGRHSSRTSEVDFGDCTELATGTTVALDKLQDRMPDGITALSLTDQGFLFPGSDDLGILITRTLECDSITVTRTGQTRTQYDRHIAHIGTPVDAVVLPASPFSNDGNNGADFNNYIFAYYSDSGIYRQAMRRAGVQGVGAARIDLVDNPVAECVVDRTVTVRPVPRMNNYGFAATGIVPDAACEPPVVPFVANWWSVRGHQAAVLSNNIPGQSAIFFDTTETIVTITPGQRSELSSVFGADTAVADAFGLTGHIPDSDGLDMIITQAGDVSS